MNQEHHEIMKAILAHDITRASELLARHFQTTTGIVVESLDESAPTG